VERWHVPCEEEIDFLNVILIYFCPTINCFYFNCTEFSYLDMSKDKGKAVPLQAHRHGHALRIPEG